MLWKEKNRMRTELYGGWHEGHHHGRHCMRGHGGERGHRGRGGWGGHHGRFGGGRGGGGRFFDHGELRYVVLALLGEQPRHGYDIIRAIEQRTGGAYSPSPGVIYPTLQLLEDVGHAKQMKGDDERNSYAITPEGRAFLDEHEGRIKDILARMDQVGRLQRSASPAIMAAMDDLKSALRSGAETWTEADVQEIADAIESAASRIRKLRDAARKPKP
jgi:DNA-binding PadR family transcriptional regulator